MLCEATGLPRHGRVAGVQLASAGRARQGAESCWQVHGVGWRVSTANTDAWRRLRAFKYERTPASSAAQARPARPSPCPLLPAPLAASASAPLLPARAPAGRCVEGGQAWLENGQRSQPSGRYRLSG